jgi:hypothetical protein
LVEKNGGLEWMRPTGDKLAQPTLVEAQIEKLDARTDC